MCVPCHCSQFLWLFLLQTSCKDLVQVEVSLGHRKAPLNLNKGDEVKHCCVIGHQQDAAHLHCITFSLWFAHYCPSLSVFQSFSLCTLLPWHPLSFPFPDPHMFISHHHLLWRGSCPTPHFALFHRTQYSSLWRTYLANVNQIPANAIKWLLRENLSLLFVFEMDRTDWGFVKLRRPPLILLGLGFSSILSNINPLSNLLNMLKLCEM